MTRDQIIDEDLKKLREGFRREAAAFKGDPERARQWLIRVGILNKSGKKIVKRYRRR